MTMKKDELDFILQEGEGLKIEFKLKKMSPQMSPQMPTELEKKILIIIKNKSRSDSALRDLPWWNTGFGGVRVRQAAPDTHLK